MVAAPDKDLEYLIRRFTLEKGYAVLADEVKDDEPVIRSVDESRFGYDLPAVYFEELEPLRPHFDVLLVRADGMNFGVLGLRKVNGRPPEPVERETLLSVGEACLDYAGKMNGQRMPVTLEVLEVHERDFQPEGVNHLEDLTVGYPGKRKVGVNAYAVGFASGRVWSHGNPFARFGRGRYLKRILSAKDEPEHRMVEAVEQSGISLPHILLGAVVGVLLALGLRYLLAVLGAEDGRLYGGVDYIVAIAASSIAVMARRIRSSSAAQSAIAALLYVILLYGGLMYLFGAPFSFWMPINALLIVGMAYWLGGMSEMS